MAYQPAAINTEVTLLASAARTATTNSTDQTTQNQTRLALVVNISATAGGSITPSIQVKDAVSGNYVTVWTAASAQTGAATYTYYFADGASGGSFTETIPAGIASKVWRLRTVHNNGTSITYSASGEILA